MLFDFVYDFFLLFILSYTELEESLEVSRLTDENLTVASELNLASFFRLGLSAFCLTYEYEHCITILVFVLV